MFHSHILKEGGYFSDGCSLSSYSNIAHSADHPHAQWNRRGGVTTNRHQNNDSVRCSNRKLYAYRNYTDNTVTRNMGLASVI